MDGYYVFSSVYKSQGVLGGYHFASAKRLDILQGSPADDGMVAARWAEALYFLIKAAAQGDTRSQTICAEICATGDRSVLQNWTTAREMVAQGSRRRRGECTMVHRTVLLLRARCGSRRCTGDGVVQKVRGARWKSCVCANCATLGYPGRGCSGNACSFYECWLCAAPTRSRAQVCDGGE
jgi:hypothetical protein